MGYMQTNNLSLIDFWKNEQQKTDEDGQRKEVKEKKQKGRKERRIQRNSRKYSLEQLLGIYTYTSFEMSSECV